MGTKFKMEASPYIIRNLNERIESGKIQPIICRFNSWLTHRCLKVKVYDGINFFRVNYGVIVLGSPLCVQGMIFLWSTVFI